MDIMMGRCFKNSRVCKVNERKLPPNTPGTFKGKNHRDIKGKINARGLVLLGERKIKYWAKSSSFNRISIVIIAIVNDEHQERF
jgi:hypothetical protein